MRHGLQSSSEDPDRRVTVAQLTTPFRTMSDSLSSEGYTTPGQSMRKIRRIRVMYCHT